MKLFASFVAIYMVLLSIAPCGDKDDCKILPTQQTTISISDHNSTEPHTEEACTPFCSCNCCSISMMKTVPLYPIVVIEELLDKDKFYSNSKLPKTEHPIWQPPRLV